MLLRLAEVLGVADLSELTGDQRLSLAHLGKARHESLDAITRSLTSYSISQESAAEPATADDLSSRVRDHPRGPRRPRPMPETPRSTLQAPGQPSWPRPRSRTGCCWGRNCRPLWQH